LYSISRKSCCNVNLYSIRLLKTSGLFFSENVRVRLPKSNLIPSIFGWMSDRRSQYLLTQINNTYLFQLICYHSHTQLSYLPFHFGVNFSTNLCKKHTACGRHYVAPNKHHECQVSPVMLVQMIVLIGRPVECNTKSFVFKIEI